MRAFADEYSPGYLYAVSIPSFWVCGSHDKHALQQTESQATPVYTASFI